MEKLFPVSFHQMHSQILLNNAMGWTMFIANCTQLWLLNHLKYASDLVGLTQRTLLSPLGRTCRLLSIVDCAIYFWLGICWSRSSTHQLPCRAYLARALQQAPMHWRHMADVALQHGIRTTDDTAHLLEASVGAAPHKPQGLVTEKAAQAWHMVIRSGAACILLTQIISPTSSSTLIANLTLNYSMYQQLCIHLHTPVTWGSKNLNIEDSNSVKWQRFFQVLSTFCCSNYHPDISIFMIVIFSSYAPADTFLPRSR